MVSELQQDIRSGGSNSVLRRNGRKFTESRLLRMRCLHEFHELKYGRFMCEHCGEIKSPEEVKMWYRVMVSNLQQKYFQMTNE